MTTTKWIMTMNTKTIHINIQISSKEMYDTRGTLLRTDPNIAVSVSKVVIVIVTRPAKIWNKNRFIYYNDVNTRSLFAYHTNIQNMNQCIWFNVSLKSSENIGRSKNIMLIGIKKVLYLKVAKSFQSHFTIIQRSLKHTGTIWSRICWIIDGYYTCIVMEMNINNNGNNNNNTKFCMGDSCCPNITLSLVEYI